MRYLLLEISEDAELAQEAIGRLLEMNPQQLWRTFQEWMLVFLPRLVSALLVLAIGHIIILTLNRAFKKILQRSRIDPTLHKFLRSILRVTLYILLGMICLGILHISLAPLITLIGTAGLALSLALKDSLSNVAGGLSVLFSRPFAQNDLINVKGVTGVVDAIDLVYTKIHTDDDKVVFLPNGDVAKSVVINFSATPLKRMDFVFSIPISADFEAAKAIILPVLQSTAYTLQEPEPSMHISGRSEDSAIVTCKVWAREEHYEAIYGPLGDEIDRRLKAADM